MSRMLISLVLWNVFRLHPSRNSSSAGSRFLQILMWPGKKKKKKAD